MNNSFVILRYVVAVVIAIISSSIDIHAEVEIKDIFGNAKWIGASSGRLPFHPDRLTVFEIGFNLSIEKGSKARFIYGADDPRLMDRNMNIYNLENARGESFIGVDFSSDGTISVYRAGYSPSDDPEVPVTTMKCNNLKNDGSVNRIKIRSNFGHTDIFVNGEKAGYHG